MNASLLADTVSALDAAVSYLINEPYRSDCDHGARKEVLMNMSLVKGRLSYHLKQIKVEVETA
jgi:hypothetical protein